MLRSRIIALLICSLGGCTVIIALNWLAKWKSDQPNAFLRKQPSHLLVGTGFVKLSDRSWYFAGGDTSRIILGNKLKRNLMAVCQVKGRKISFEQVTGFDTMRFNQEVVLRAAGNDLYLFDGIKPVVLSGELKDWRLTEDHKTPYFTLAVPLSPSSYIIRTTVKGMRNILTKIVDKKPVARYPLEAQGDGFFSTDGQLSYSDRSSKLCYTYYYRNQFVCLDTNLHIVYKGKTIDTVAHVHIKISAIKSDQKRTFSAPPFFVNKQSTMNDQYLFVHSALKANNDIDAVINTSSVMDVYETQTGKYKFSLYLTDFAGEKLRDFRVYGNLLAVLYDHYLYFYHLKF